jgi:guanine deaminase
VQSTGQPVAFRGTLVDFAANGALRVIDDGCLVVQDGRVAGIQEPPPSAPVVDCRGRFILPGFIDAHVHYPQVDVIATPSGQLLDWLDGHTFPAEAAYADAGKAAETAEFFLGELLKNGTTTAAVYPSVHKVSVDAFFTAAARRGLRMAAGKVMMDRNCPEPLRDDTEASYEECAELIDRWHGHGRLVYAVTPRFAATSSERQLELAAKLLERRPGILMQTHIAENAAEMRWVAELFPWSSSYLDVYDHFGLVRPGALFGHCIHFDDASWRRLAASGAAAVHCPTSNLFLGSGLFDYARARAAGATVALATDVGGGTSLGMLQTMHEAYKVAKLRGADFSSLDAFYLATRGGARALGLEDRIGSFDVGCEADFVVLDPGATPLLERRMRRAATIEEKLFVLMVLGDDRAVEATYVMGERAQ